MVVARFKLMRLQPARLLALVLTSLWAHSAAQSPRVAVTAERLSSSPVISSNLPWAATGVFNPAAVKFGSKTVVLFRATDKSMTSRIGYAESDDGVHFAVRGEPVLQPETGYEMGGGVEDPRLVLIDGLYYLTYTGYNRHDAQLCLATSRDLIHWDRKGVILPAYKGAWNVGWTKSGAIIPQQINGKWWMYYMGTLKDARGEARDYMGIAQSDDLIHWTDATDQPVLSRRPGAFDSRVMEPGPPPIVTGAGILLLYNGADDRLVYGPAWALFDIHDPSRLIGRADAPFLIPELDWERQGVVPNVIFLEGAITNRRASGAIDLTGYYGAADKHIGALRMKVRIPARQ